jgi:hypothetical protein
MLSPSCLCVVWIPPPPPPALECLKLGMYTMAPKHTSTAYFINPSHQSVCLYITPIVARRQLGEVYHYIRC